MKKKFKTTGIGKKVIPATAALGILFSMAPIAENKASAGIGGAVVDVSITVLGIVKDIYQAFGIDPGEDGPGTRIDEYAENLTYKAPNFTSGEFNISMYHTENDSKFTKSVKVLYPNGKIEIYKLKSGNQLKITEAGTIIDLNPDAKSVSEHNLLYITQSQLDEGKTGVVMNQAETAFVEKASGQNPRLVNAFYKKQFGKDSLDGFKGLGVDRFSYLTEENKKLATLTSKPVGKEVLSNYVTNDSETFADFNDRLVNVFADTKLMLKTSIGVENSVLDATPYQIIPIKKGSNKVIVKKGLEYLSGKEGTELQYSGSIGDDEILELVPIENSGTIRFDLINKNGAHLSFTNNHAKFTTDKERPSNLRFTAKTDTGLHNWLREWYPGKENEKQKYDGIQIVADTYDGIQIAAEKYRYHKLLAKDPSGNVIKNSWVTVSDVHYYAGSDGFLLKGWQEIEGKTYYFKDDYSMLKENSWDTPIDNKFYNFDDNGALQRSAWTSHSKGCSAYSDASGEFVEGLREIEGKIYYFASRVGSQEREVRLEDQNIILHFSGDKGALEKASKLNGEALDKITYVNFSEKKLVFEKDGSIRKNGVSKIMLPEFGHGSGETPTLVYYSLEDGPFYSGWKEINGKKYYFEGGQNYNFDFTRNIDGKKYYFNQEGEVLPTGFIDIDGIPYYLNDKSEKVTGIHNIDGKLYLFSKGDKLRVYGEKVRNTIYSWDGNRYYTDHDGVISQNFKGTVYSHDADYHIETNNEGVINKIWKR